MLVFSLEVIPITSAETVEEHSNILWLIISNSPLIITKVHQVSPQLSEVHSEALLPQPLGHLLQRPAGVLRHQQLNASKIDQTNIWMHITRIRRSGKGNVVASNPSVRRATGASPTLIRLALDLYMSIDTCMMIRLLPFIIKSIIAAVIVHLALESRVLEHFDLLRGQ